MLTLNTDGSLYQSPLQAVCCSGQSTVIRSTSSHPHFVRFFPASDRFFRQLPFWVRVLGCFLTYGPCLGPARRSVIGCSFYRSLMSEYFFSRHFTIFRSLCQE